MNRAVAVLAFMLASCAFAQDPAFGKFSGPVKAEWLGGAGRDMKLLEDLTFVDPRGLLWLAPKGAVVNGASIPKVAWSIVGGPYEGTYRDASVIHDVACDEKKRSWEDVHEVFYFGMRASGVAPLRAKLMYGAVYHFGPRWEHETIEYVAPAQVPMAAAAASGKFAPGSKVQIAIEDHYIQGFGATGAPQKVPSGLKKVTVRAAPPPTLSEQDAEALKKAITEKDLDLEQIRTFRAR